MGYDLHIKRPADPSEDEDEDVPIELDEWIAYVRSDPEMRLDGVAHAPLPSGETLTYESPGLAVWTAYSRGTAWFDHRIGRISVKNPDAEIIGKMRSIARALGARVEGDEGETY